MVIGQCCKVGARMRDVPLDRSYNGLTENKRQCKVGHQLENYFFETRYTIHLQFSFLGILLQIINQ